VLQGAVRRPAHPRWMDMAIGCLRDWQHKEFKMSNDVMARPASRALPDQETARADATRLQPAPPGYADDDTGTGFTRQRPRLVKAFAPRVLSDTSEAEDVVHDHVADDPPVDEQVTAENRSWVRRLTADGAEFDEAVTALYRLLVKIGYSEAKRKGARLHLAGPELDDVAHQAAADATLTICRKVETFRGDCRFTTWAYRFVVFDVSSKVSRHVWQRPTISIDDNEWTGLAANLGEAPETQAENRDLVEAIQRAFREDLSERQQRAFEAVVVRGVPVREVAEELTSNPNAIYKTLSDARRKLRRSLASAGYLAGTAHSPKPVCGSSTRRPAGISGQR
jgi:RNA polymerase sigma factor (sigma-70 family)